MVRTLLWLIFFPALLLWGADFDCAFIGTSPISLFEALHQHHLGRRVLMLDDAQEIGGAWKAIDICGVAHADVGCHHIGHDRSIQEFLEQCVGCKLVHMDRPTEPFVATNGGTNGYYFSGGCFELMETIKRLFAETTIQMRLGQRVEAAAVDVAEPCVVLTVGGERLTASKVFVPWYSSFAFQNDAARGTKTKYYHLYVLIADGAAPAFSYHASGGAHASRIMNLTQFVGLAGSGRQLIIFQTHNEQGLHQGAAMLQELKTRKLVSQEAYVLREEPYIYEQWGHQDWPFQNQAALFEVLDTSHFSSMHKRVAEWKRSWR